jgi:tetratricopeptide (TPR) repeat protein
VGAKTTKALRAPFYRHAARILIIWGLAFLAYSNSFQGGLVFDSAFVIGRDPRIREVTTSNVALILTQDYWYGFAHSQLYRPLTTFSFLFNYAVLGSGPNPASYHWLNFALHTANILLVYLLMIAVLGEAGLACAAAALWALHPVLTEAVTNVVGRSDLLAAFGILAGLLAHRRAADAVGKDRLAWLFGLGLAALTAAFSKESGVVLIPAMLLFDLAFVPRAGWRTRLAGYVSAGIPVAGLLAVRARMFMGQVDPFPFLENPIAGAGFWTAKLTAVKVMGKCLALVVWPVTLSSDYSYDQIPLFTAGDWKAWVALATILGLVGLAIACWKRAPAVSWLVAFFFAMLAPTSNLLIPIGTIMAERFLYLPAAAAAAFAVLAWRAAARRHARIESFGPVLLVLLCGVFAVRTWARNSDWSNEVSLWSSAAEAAPNSFKAHANLAEAAVANRGLALRQAERAIAIIDFVPEVRSSPAPFSAAARGYRLEGDALPSPEGKEERYRRALSLLLRARRIATATGGAGRRESANEEVDVELGRVYKRLSQPERAREVLENARHAAPGESVCAELAAYYVERGELDAAAVAYMEALSFGTDPTRIGAKLVELYERMDAAGCSVANGALNVACPLVHGHLCRAVRNLEQLNRNLGNLPAAERLRTQAEQSFACPIGTDIPAKR